jgi:hypothetical protein
LALWKEDALGGNLTLSGGLMLDGSVFVAGFYKSLAGFSGRTFNLGGGTIKRQ